MKNNYNFRNCWKHNNNNSQPRKCIIICLKCDYERASTREIEIEKKNARGNRSRNRMNSWTVYSATPLITEIARIRWNPNEICNQKNLCWAQIPLHKFVFINGFNRSGVVLKIKQHKNYLSRNQLPSITWLLLNALCVFWFCFIRCGCYFFFISSI